MIYVGVYPPVYNSGISVIVSIKTGLLMSLGNSKSPGLFFVRNVILPSAFDCKFNSFPENDDLRKLFPLKLCWRREWDKVELESLLQLAALKSGGHKHF